MLVQSPPLSRRGLTQALGRVESLLDSYRYRVSLRLRHPTEPLAQFTSILGLTPEFERASGQPRKGRKGEPLPGNYNESYWCHGMDIPEGHDIEPFLLSAVDRLAAYEPHFKQLASSGGKAELFVGFFLESFNSGFSLAPELLHKCASLGLTLDFDLYGQSDTPGPAA